MLTFLGLSSFLLLNTVWQRESSLSPIFISSRVEPQCWHKAWPESRTIMFYSFLFEKIRPEAASTRNKATDVCRRLAGCHISPRHQKKPLVDALPTLPQATWLSSPPTTEKLPQIIFKTEWQFLSAMTTQASEKWADALLLSHRISGCNSSIRGKRTEGFPDNKTRRWQL